MWQPQGDKLNNTDRLGSLQPVTILSDNPKTFTCRDPNEDLLLAYQCGQEGKMRRYIVVPTSDQVVEQMFAGTQDLRTSLTQVRTWLVDVEDSGKVLAAWKSDLAKIPGDAVPKAGAAPAAPEALSLPIVSQPLTLTYWAPMSTNVAPTMKSFGEIACYVELEKRTGIHLDFQHPPLQQEQDQFSAQTADVLPENVRYVFHLVGQLVPGYRQKNGTQRHRLDNHVAYSAKYLRDFTVGPISVKFGIDKSGDLRI